MHLVHAIADHDAWTLGWGLGLELHRRGERLLAGHDGGMPGYLSALVWSRRDRVACAVLSASGASGDPTALALDLVDAELADRPAAPSVWAPGDPAPPELESALGRWWLEGFEFVFSFRDGHLEARSADSQRSTKPPTVFERIDGDRFRVLSGREHGELLELDRDRSGTIERLRWAGYPATRTPEPFAPEP